MPFSFTANGATKEDALSLLAAEDEINPDMPVAFVAAVRERIEDLPERSQIDLSCYGRTEWAINQVSGEISLHLAMQVTQLPNDDE